MKLNDSISFNYPKARRDMDFVEIFHGQKIPDPYHWLSDPDSEETKAFVDAQNEITIPYLESVPERNMIKESLTKIWDYPKYGCPQKRGSRYFYRYNTGLQNQSVLYVQEGLDGTPKVFLDPNLFSEDGTVSLTVTRFSEDGAYLAYGISKSGSDWFSIKVREVATGQDLPDVIERAKFSNVSWTHDNKGFFYSRYPEHLGKGDGTETTSYVNHQLFYHRIGTSQSEDVLCVEFPDYPHWIIDGEVSHCGNYLVLSVQEECKNNILFYADLKSLPNGIKGPIKCKCIINKMDAKHEYITNEGTIFTILTDKEASKCRLVNIDIENPFEIFWKVLIPEKDDLLEWASCVAQDKLVICYQKDVKNILMYYDLPSGEERGKFPIEIGTISGFFGKKDESEIFFYFVSFLAPGIIYYSDMSSDPLKVQIFKEIKVAGLDSSQYVTKQEYYTSTDGTEVPMFLVHKKDLDTSSPAPCMLYGYGGFNISLLPAFNPAWYFFVKHFGGIFAMANIRGGGEFGLKWYDGGRLFNKQNCFEDFISAMKHLYKKGYSSPEKLSIQGASNGGLLVASVLNQAPHLIGCAIARVGVLDLLRFHRYTIGRAWCCDYGCSDDKDHFNNLLKLSPLHNIKFPESGQYPATLLLTADHDDRVVPLHTLKFIAELQHAIGSNPKQTNPLMVRVEVKAGHGYGKPTTKIIDEYTDIYCFIIKSLGLKYMN